MIADVATAVQEWAVATVPDLAGSYDYPPDSKDQPLPDVAVEITESARGEIDPADFPELASVEQRRVLTHSVELMLMVAPEPAREASQALYGFADDLLAALDDDRRIGDESLLAGRRVTASFRPAFVKFDDDTVGRAATLRFRVAERTS